MENWFVSNVSKCLTGYAVKKAHMPEKERPPSSAICGSKITPFSTEDDLSIKYVKAHFRFPTWNILLIVIKKLNPKAKS